MDNGDLDYEDLQKMKEEIREFRKILSENKLESYNPEYHLSKKGLSEMLGVSTERITAVAKKWEAAGVFEKVNVRYSAGRRGVAYVLLPDWKENLINVLSE